MNKRYHIVNVMICLMFVAILVFGDCGIVMAADINAAQINSISGSDVEGDHSVSLKSLPVNQKEETARKNLLQAVPDSVSVQSTYETQVYAPYVKLVNATETSVTYSWSPVYGASIYQIVIANDKTYTNVVTTTATSYTFYNLPKDSAYACMVCSSDGVTVSDWSTACVGFVVPTKVTGVKNYSFSDGVASFSFNSKPRVSGFEYSIYTYNGKTPIKTGISTSYANSLSAGCNSMKYGKFYRIRIRGYSTLTNGSKKYGAYSSDLYFTGKPKKLKLKRSGSGVRLSWSKVSGAKNYTLYISTKKKSGFKKIKTTSKKNSTIKTFKGKKFKKGKSYYLLVVPNRKVGKTTFKGAKNRGWRLKF